MNIMLVFTTVINYYADTTHKEDLHEDHSYHSRPVPIALLFFLRFLHAHRGDPWIIGLPS